MNKTQESTNTTPVILVLLATVVFQTMVGCHKTDKAETTPIIGSVTPGQGMAGDTIVIAGSSYATDKELDTVRFNGVQAEVTSATTSELTVVVPDLATTGRITVKVGASSISSTHDFTIKPHEISNFSPVTGRIGELIEITGSGFAQGCEVYFGNEKATEVNFINRGKITAKVPAGALTGKVRVIAHGKNVLSTADFAVIHVVADFSYTLVPNALPGQTKVIFNNTSYGADFYDWEINYQTAYTKDLVWYFSKTGTYEVKLTVGKGDKTHFVVKTININTDNSVVAYYPFNMHAIDEVSGTRALAYQTTLTTDRKQQEDAAYEFNGVNSFIKLPDGLIANTGGAASLSLWFQAVTPSTATVLFGYQDAEVGATTGTQFVPSVYIGTNQKIHGKFWFGAGAMQEGYELNTNWHHLVLTGDATGQLLYVDGVQVATSNDAVNNAGSMIHNQLGAGFVGTGWPHIPMADWYFFKGKLDDVRIYKRKLTAAEVTSLHNE